MMNVKWRDRHPHLLHSLSSLLHAASYRLNFLPIEPDFIFNTAGLSIAFIFIASWESEDDTTATFGRIEKMKAQFGHFYVIATIKTNDDNRRFIDSYFKSGLAIGKPTFIPVRNAFMGFEKMLKLALVHGEIKRHDVVAKINIEREQSVQSVEACISALTAIPGIDTHDAHTLMQGLGSIEAISKASQKAILESTDLCAEKAETIVKFFNDPQYYLRPNIK